MPAYISGQALNNAYKTVAASQTTANISVAGDGVRDRDFVEKVIITWASSGGGTVTLLDGTTSLFVAAMPAVAGVPMVYTVDVGVFAQTTKGFNVTTGSSVSCVVVGRFSN